MLVSGPGSAELRFISPSVPNELSVEHLNGSISLYENLQTDSNDSEITIEKVDVIDGIEVFRVTSARLRPSPLGRGTYCLKRGSSYALVTDDNASLVFDLLRLRERAKQPR